VAGPMAEQVRQLAEAEFHEDALEIVETGGMWEATAFADERGGLVGFVVFGALNGAMSLRFISVVPHQRKRGCGRLLVEHVVGRCAERGIRELSLFCRRELVGFYRAVGFHEVPEEEGDSEDDLQVPMLLLLPRSLDLGPAGRPPRLEEAAEEEEREEEPLGESGAGLADRG